MFEAFAHYDRARVLQARGEILRALAEVRQGLQRLQGLSPQRLYAVRARLTLYEGFLLALRLQPQAARGRLHAGLDEARACRDISVLIGHCVIAPLEGGSGEFAKAFAELAEAERLMHIWTCRRFTTWRRSPWSNANSWLAQGRIDLAGVEAGAPGQTYSGEQPAAAPDSIRSCRCTSNCSKHCSRSIQWPARCWPRGAWHVLLKQGQASPVGMMLSRSALSQ